MHNRDRNGLLRVCLYPVLFCENPVAEVDRVVDMILKNAEIYAPPENFYLAIDAGLASSDQLSKLLPQPHSEETVRRFLAALGARLRTKCL
jgi:hypothetical protein